MTPRRPRPGTVGGYLKGVDLYEEDGGYSVAGHIIDELNTAPDGLDAAELGALVADATGAEMGAALRSLHEHQLVRKVRVSPGSLRVRWFTTAEGDAYLLEQLERAGKIPA